MGKVRPHAFGVTAESAKRSERQRGEAPMGSEATGTQSRSGSQPPKINGNTSIRIRTEPPHRTEAGAWGRSTPTEIGRNSGRMSALGKPVVSLKVTKGYGEGTSPCFRGDSGERKALRAPEGRSPYGERSDWDAIQVRQPTSKNQRKYNIRIRTEGVWGRYSRRHICARVTKCLTVKRSYHLDNQAKG